MNLNLSSVLNASTLKNVTDFKVKNISIDNFVKIVLASSFLVLIINTGSVLEYSLVILLLSAAYRVYSFGKDLFNLDLHFSNENIELKEIINDLWK